MTYPAASEKRLTSQNIPKPISVMFTNEDFERLVSHSLYVRYYKLEVTLASGININDYGHIKRLLRVVHARLPDVWQGMHPNVTNLTK